MRIVGLDLASSPKHASGVCVLERGRARVETLHADNNIILAILDSKPALVAIDAPLSFPKEGLLRKAEQALHRRGIKCFPPLGLESMERLTLRGRLVAKVFRRLGVNVIEVFSGGALDVWGIKRDDSEGVRKLLRAARIRLPRNAVRDGLDAAVCALVGRMCLQQKTIALGERKEGRIHMPKRGMRR